MKRLIGIFSSLSFLAVLGCSHFSGEPGIPVYSPNENCKLVGFKAGSEPQGFNGIRWETDLSTIKEMKLHRKDPSHGGIDFYLKPGDGFKLKNGKLIPVQYGFWRGKFYVGLVMTEKTSDWGFLKEAVFERFGMGAKPFTNREEYLWCGKEATMALRYDENSKMGTYYIRSHSMEKLMN